MYHRLESRADWTDTAVLQTRLTEPNRSPASRRSFGFHHHHHHRRARAISHQQRAPSRPCAFLHLCRDTSSISCRCQDVLVLRSIESGAYMHVTHTKPSYWNVGLSSLCVDSLYMCVSVSVIRKVNLSQVWLVPRLFALWNHIDLQLMCVLLRNWKQLHMCMLIAIVYTAILDI